MIINKITCKLNQGHVLLHLETDLGEEVIDLSSVKLSLLEQNLIYVGFGSLPPVTYVYDDGSGRKEVVLNGMSADPILLDLARKFMFNAAPGLWSNRKVLYRRPNHPP